MKNLSRFVDWEFVKTENSFLKGRRWCQLYEIQKSCEWISIIKRPRIWSTGLEHWISCSPHGSTKSKITILNFHEITNVLTIQNVFVFMEKTDHEKTIKWSHCMYITISKIVMLSKINWPYQRIQQRFNPKKSKNNFFVKPFGGEQLIFSMFSRIFRKLNTNLQCFSPIFPNSFL